MKKTLSVGFIVLASALTVVAAVKFKVPQLKAVGVLQQPVMAQTVPEFVEKRAGFTILRKFYIARWGTERYEYGVAHFQCRTSRCEMMGEPSAIKFYRQCFGFKKNGQVNCRGVESARVDLPYSNEPDDSVSRRRWYHCDDYDRPCESRDELNEFPSRYTPEDPDLPNGI